MKNLSALLFLLPIHIAAQTNHDLIHTDDLGFQPDSLYALAGDSIHVTFDTTGHSMVEVPMDSWLVGSSEPHIGISIGEGTINPGVEFTVPVDSAGVIYYLCAQHPNDEKGIIFVSGEVGIAERALADFLVYPQPANDLVNLKAGTSHERVRIEDANGRVIAGPFAHDMNSPIDVSRLSTGSHFITLLDHDGNVVGRQQFVIAR